VADTTKVAVRNLLEREYIGGTRVVNCVPHMNLDILNRPHGCERCAADQRNLLSTALRANEWLNGWKDDATKILRGLA
jgi:hypothetical protein